MSSVMTSERVLVTGASGLIGSALVSALRADGVEVSTLVRREARGPDERCWSPATREMEPGALAGVQAIVHLAGANIAQRWTREAQQNIRTSRIDSTDLLSRAIAEASIKPRVLVSGSAVGFYGDRGDETVDELTPAGTGFLADVCREWEAATQPAETAGVRVVHIRTGIVLSPRGGMLRRLLPLFRLGAGGRLGSGCQWTSWIALFDVVRAIRCALDKEPLEGPLNLVAPNPVRNSEFAQTLGSVLRRPAVLPVPPFALRFALGKAMSDEALLGGQRVRPSRLLEAGFQFEAPTLESALRQLLTKSEPSGGR